MTIAHTNLKYVASVQWSGWDQPRRPAGCGEDRAQKSERDPSNSGKKIRNIRQDSDVQKHKLLEMIVLMNK